MNPVDIKQPVHPKKDLSRPMLNRTVSYYSSMNLNERFPVIKKTNHRFPGFEEIIRTESTLHLSLTPRVAL
ncbi:hypothetical protein K7432_014381 [Basidiobolus ranarum]|uniref:Uncharacterized protein n=1 Tax=Basidiobolus ranarum TaxID=34480 RepID=A0ABR2WHP7_9FUNG